MLRLLALVAWCACVLAMGCRPPAGPVPTSTPTPSPSAGPAVTAFVHVELVPTAGAERLRDQTVLIEGDRIVAVGPATAVEVPAGAMVIEGSGKTLIPGLVDMHVHLPPLIDEHLGSVRRAMVTMVANGVTTARSLAGQPSHVELRQRIDAGELLGPTLSPAQALAAATSVPARYLESLPSQGSATGRAADFGVVATGRRADLVLLTGSPLDDVRTTRCIDGVMLRGEWLDRPKLDAMLREVAVRDADAPGPVVPQPAHCTGRAVATTTTRAQAAG